MTLRGEGARYGGSNPLPTVVIARRSFPNANSAMDRLFEVFPDKYPALIAESGEEWTFALGWPRHILEHVDPLLTERAHTCFGIGLPDLETYVEVNGDCRIPFVFSMFHSWAILAPALWMKVSGQIPQVVMHVDAHHDLSSTLMDAVSPELLLNEAFGVECGLDRPDSLNAAIQKGLINKANFLTAYLLASNGRIIHVEAGCVSQQFEVKSVTAPVAIGNVSTSEHSLAFQRIDDGSEYDLLELPELPTSLGLAPNEQVWLDIDLDAFCNRFDGDSDNCSKAGSKEEADVAIERTHAFIRDLREADWLKNIVAVSVAASPGFCPSEYWERLIPVIRDGVRRLLAE